MPEVGAREDEVFDRSLWKVAARENPKEESIQELSMKNANVPELDTGSYGRSAGTRRSAASGSAPSPRPSTESTRSYRSSSGTRAATRATWWGSSGSSTSGAAAAGWRRPCARTSRT